MAKIKKKGQAGAAKNFITRTQAVRKLQISLPDFRRLCIFKGIYPREPRNLKKASKSASHSTTFYYTKDIQYLLHEPLLAKFRDQKALSKKIAKSLGRNEVQDAARLEKTQKPKIKLDHIVRERYPTFVDALRDLDDALALLFLFANLPSTSTVPPRVISRCQRLCHEFEHYVITSHSLRKSFLSIKGIYYQVTIQGQDIMWVVPYRFVQQASAEVDYRIMSTFVEFYCTLLGFVNYRLYTTIGLVYPPKFDTTSDERGAELAAFTLQGRSNGQEIANGSDQKQLTNGHTEDNSAALQAQIELAAAAQEAAPAEEEPVADVSEDTAETDAIDKFEVVAPQGDVLAQPSLSGNQAASLFANLTVYISREAPRHSIEFLLRAFGCKRVGWDAVLGDGAFTQDETDPRITHQIVDRPAFAEPLQAQHNGATANGEQLQKVKPGYIMPGRVCVQPQWVWDCVNEGELQSTDTYAPGATLPPHLSPWVKPTKGQYDPRATLEEQEAEGEADDDSEVEEEDEEVEEQVTAELEDAANGEGGSEIDAGDMDVAGSDDAESGAEEADENDMDGFEGFEDEAEEVDDEEALHQKELAAEAAGLAINAKKPNPEQERKDKARKERQVKQSKEDEEIERRKMMMSNKKRKLFEKMQYGNEKKDAEAAALRKKRRKLEKSQ
jgi:pescadillo